MVTPSSLGTPPAQTKPLLRGWLHLGAFVCTLVAGPLLAMRGSGAAATFELAVYVLSLTCLFGVSAAYHRRDWAPPARRRLRRADHSMIFFAIAGTYTAVAGLALHGWARTFILCLVWVGTVAGIALRQFWLDAPKWAVAVPYVVVGWSALAVLPELERGLSAAGFAILLLGGAFYTAGALVYARRKPDPAPQVFGFHEVFHACTLAGAALQFAAVAAFALPRA